MVTGVVTGGRLQTITVYSLLCTRDAEGGDEGDDRRMRGNDGKRQVFLKW